MAQEYTIVCPNCGLVRNVRFANVFTEVVADGIRGIGGQNILRGGEKSRVPDTSEENWLDLKPCPECHIPFSFNHITGESRP